MYFFKNILMSQQFNIQINNTLYDFNSQFKVRLTINKQNLLYTNPLELKKELQKYKGWYASFMQSYDSIVKKETYIQLTNMTIEVECDNFIYHEFECILDKQSSKRTFFNKHGTETIKRVHNLPLIILMEKI